MSNQAREEALDRADKALMSWLVAALKANVPANELPVDQRVACAQQFLEFVGRFQAVLESTTPSPAKAAALVFVGNSLNLERAAEAPLRLVLTLVEAMNKLQESLHAANQQEPS